MSNPTLALRLAQHRNLEAQRAALKVEADRVAELIAAQCPHAIGDVLQPTAHWERPFRVERIKAEPFYDQGYVWVLAGPVLRKNGTPHASHIERRTVHINEEAL